MKDDLYARADAKLQEAMRLLNDVRWIISEAMPPKPSSRPFCGHCDMTHMDGGTCHASDVTSQLPENKMRHEQESQDECAQCQRGRMEFGEPLFKCKACVKGQHNG